jgi:hypothetical protein
MCGRYTLTVTLADLMMYYERGQSLKLGELRWGINPTLGKRGEHRSQTNQCTS